MIIMNKIIINKKYMTKMPSTRIIIKTIMKMIMKKAATLKIKVEEVEDLEEAGVEEEVEGVKEEDSMIRKINI